MARLTSFRQGTASTFLVLCCSALLFAIRLTAPANLLDKDQERPASYVLDALLNGHWICQVDFSGDVTSKPPVWTWIAAAVAFLGGRISLFAIYLPGALAALGTAYLVLVFGRKAFGERAALIAAIGCLFSIAALKEFGLARTDGVFAFFVTATALSAFQAWTSSGSWVWFWLVGAVATLTKGPLGLLLAAAGLAAAYWEDPSVKLLRVRRFWWPGSCLFLLLTAGWFLLAYGELGRAVLAKMIGQELVGKALHEDHRWPGVLLYQPILYYLGRAAPWSVFALAGLWRIWKNPAAESKERQCERFLFAWFIGGLFLFSMAPHQRPDHLWPIIPAGALIAGRELSRLTRRVAPGVFYLASAAVMVLGIGGAALYYFGPQAHTAVVQQTMELRRLASRIEAMPGAPPVSHVDDPFTLQFYLNTCWPSITFERGIQLLHSREPVLLAVTDLDRLIQGNRDDPTPIYTIDGSREHSIFLVSNCPALASTHSFAFCYGDILIEGSRVRLVEATNRRFSFTALEPSGEITLTNESGQSRQLHLCIIRQGFIDQHERVVPSHGVWKVRISDPTK